MLSGYEIDGHMIQYYLDLETQVKSIQDKRLSYGQIQKIYSTAFFISMAIRTPGKTWHIYLGRGGGFEGIWLHDCAPPSELRRKDNFLEYLRHHLSACSLIDVILDPHDRIIRLDYQKYGQKHSLLLFWKARKLYFVHRYQDQPEGPFKLLLSWRGKAVTLAHEDFDLFDYFDEIGRSKDMSHDLKSKQPVAIKELLDVELQTANLKTLGTHPTFLQRKKENIEDDLRKAQQWQRLQTILDKNESLDVYELKVDDQKIKFEGDLNPYERRNLLFQKIKKLKRGEGILTERLASVNSLISGKEQQTQKVSTIPIIRPVWGKEEEVKPVMDPSQEKDDFKIYKFSNYQIGVGLTSRGNDQLRNKWAHKEDYWLHLDDSKSAHVIIKLINQTPLDPTLLSLGSSILAQFSHFNGDWIPIIYTQVKNLKGVTGAPGMVIYKKEKHLRCQRVDLDKVEGNS